MATRKYKSKLREQQARDTRRRILEGAARIALFDFGRVTHAAVAASAEVSERTVYRHFPTVDELHVAFGEFQEKRFKASYPEDLSIDDLPMLFERWPDTIDETSVDEFLRDEAPSPVLTRSRSKRYRQMEVMLSKLLPDATPPQVHQLVVVFGALMSPQAFIRGKSIFNLSPSEVVRGPAWAMRVLIAAIRKGDTPWK